MASRTFDHNNVVIIVSISPMDDQSFHKFIAERPALNLSVLTDELTIDRVNLYKIMRAV